MHSFQPSRGRIFFEVLCVLGIAGSLAAAWQQTGATALLGGSAAAALFGLSHAFGMRRGPGAAVEPQRIDFEPVERADHLIGAAEITSPTVELQVEPAEPVVVMEPPEPVLVREPVEPVVSQARKVRQAKAPRKGGGGRGARKNAKVAEVVPFDQAEAAHAASPEESVVGEPALPEEADVVDHMFDEEPDLPRIEPLFEPDPYFRARRSAFGRKAG